MKHLQESVLGVFGGNCLMSRKVSTGSAFKYFGWGGGVYFQIVIWYNRIDLFVSKLIL